MDGTKYRDENGKYEFEFPQCEVWEYHQLAQKTTILSDVDFVINSPEEVIFLEYKNASINGVANPNAFLCKLRTEEFYIRASKKFYSSLFLHWACRENENDRPIVYTLLIEHPEIDGKIRKKLREKISKQLPIRFKDEQQIKRNVLNRFEVLNIDEWHQAYPLFKAVAL
jgi:hypothetical protein